MYELIIDNNDDTLEFAVESSGDIKLLTAEIQPQEVATFDPTVSEADKWDYIAATASGVLTSVLNTFWVKGLSLTDAKSWGVEKTNTFVKRVAEFIGYNGKDDLAGAIRFLEKTFPMASDKATSELGGALQHHVRDFSHHPTIAGLLFSLLTQFTGKYYGTDVNGSFISGDLPADALIESDFSKKIFVGFVGWAMHLVSDMAGSNATPGKGTGIPGPLLSTLKELSVLPFFKSISVKYKNDNIGFSVWISKLFNGTYFKDGDKPLRFDLRTELGLMHQLTKMSLPVFINECLVRAFYFVRRFFDEIKSKNVTSLSELHTLNWKRVLPFNNRTIARLMTISSGVFVTSSTVGAAVKAVATCEGSKEKAIISFVLNINYIGVGRFAYACFVDSKYIYEDVKETYALICDRYRLKKPREILNLNSLYLSPEQTRIVYSLMYHKVKCDIEKTRGAYYRTKKDLWLSKWCELTIQNLKVANDYYIEDETELFASIQIETKVEKHREWLKLAMLQVISFVPYFMLGVDEDSKFKGIKMKDDSFANEISEKSCIMDNDELQQMAKALDDYLNLLNGSSTKLTILAAVVATVLTGDISGTMFSVVMGTDALGGLIIHTGNTSEKTLSKPTMMLGKGLLGMYGMEHKSVLGFIMTKDYTLIECSKLLAFCKVILMPKIDGFKEIENIHKMILDSITSVENEIERIKNNGSVKDKVHKEQLKEAKESLKCMRKCADLLSAMIKVEG